LGEHPPRKERRTVSAEIEPSAIRLIVATTPGCRRGRRERPRGGKCAGAFRHLSAAAVATACGPPVMTRGRGGERALTMLDTWHDRAARCRIPTLDGVGRPIRHNLDGHRGGSRQQLVECTGRIDEHQDQRSPPMAFGFQKPELPISSAAQSG
jgi:hypothetical protein